MLYFEDLSAGKTLGYVADGLTEALIDALTQVPALSVVSKNGVAPYRSAEVTPDSVARALNVGSVVRGEVEMTGNRYRVSVRLIDGASGADYKRASFDQAAGNVLLMRDSLAQKVADFLRQRLGEEVRLREEQAGTRSVAAWSFLQQAERVRKDAEGKLVADDVDGAFAGFTRAESLLALSEGADAHWVEPIVERGWIAYRRARLAADHRALAHWTDVALGHAERALALAPADARALELRGTVRYTRWLQQLSADPGEQAKLLAGARRDLETATQTDGTLASAFSTLSHLYYQTDVSAAVLAARKAYEQDAYLAVARDLLWRLFIGSYDLEQFTQATRWCEEGIRRFPTYYRSTECQLWLMTTDAVDPNPGEAWRLYARIDTVTPGPVRDFELHYTKTIVGVVLARAGLADSARHVLASARADARLDPGHDLLALEAFGHTLLGDRGEAIDLLKRYVAANPTHAFKKGGDISWWWRDLRTDPRFAALLVR